MFNLNIYAIDRIPLTEMLGVTFNCGCALMVAPCEYPHEDGPCGLWAIAPSAFVCVNHHLIFNDPRSPN